MKRICSHVNEGELGFMHSCCLVPKLGLGFLTLKNLPDTCHTTKKLLFYCLLSRDVTVVCQHLKQISFFVGTS